MIFIKTRPTNSIGTDADWQIAEMALTSLGYMHGEFDIKPNEGDSDGPVLVDDTNKIIAKITINIDNSYTLRTF